MTLKVKDIKSHLIIFDTVQIMYIGRGELLYAGVAMMIPEELFNYKVHVMSIADNRLDIVVKRGKK